MIICCGWPLVTSPRSGPPGGCSCRRCPWTAVRALAGERDADAGELHRVTGGNPFYVSEVLEAGWPSVPPTVRDAVGARLARSSSGARGVVESAAVMGARVDRAILSSVLEGPGSSIGECLATGILVADGTGLRFRHELVRMAVEAAIAPHRKAGLHARLLAALEERGDADPAVLAHHAEGAGDNKAVRRHAPEAARRSAALGAHREAAAQFERALRCAGESDRPVVASLHEGVAGEYSLLDRWEEAERALRSALALRRELGDDLSAGEALRRLSTTLWRLCRGRSPKRLPRKPCGFSKACRPAGSWRGLMRTSAPPTCWWGEATTRSRPARRHKRSANACTSPAS